MRRELSEKLLMDSAVSTADESLSSPYDVARSFLMGFGVDGDSIDSSESDSNRGGSRAFFLRRDVPIGDDVCR